MNWENTIENSHKIISFIDCGGQEKHHWSQFRGFLQSQPDFTILVISILDSISNI